jgi:hypothetical protein
MLRESEGVDNRSLPQHLANLVARANEVMSRRTLCLISVYDVQSHCLKISFSILTRRVCVSASMTRLGIPKTSHSADSDQDRPEGRNDLAVGE